MSRRDGFTLIEILVVLGIIAGMLTLGIGRIRKQDNNVKYVMRKLVVLIKEVRNRARLQHSTFRIVIHMEKGKDRYWVEKSNNPFLIDTKADKDKKSSDEKKPSGFQMEKAIFKKEQDLPNTLHFGSVETLSADKPITEGDAYIHFFPEGLVEVAAIQITDRKNLTWTIVINPVTGQSDIIPKAQALKDLQR